MKTSIKRYLLLVMILAPLSMLFAQTAGELTGSKAAVYSDPSVQEAVEFMKSRLPQLVVEDKDQAIEEYMVHAENLAKLDENDLLFMVGHFYAVVDEAKTAIPYFEVLINDPRLGEDARRMLNLLLYYRAVSYLMKDDRQASQAFLEDVMNLFPTGKYYPTYLVLWADLVSESGDQQKINQYLSSYEENRNWIKNVFVPRKQGIINRLNNLDIEAYYQNPTDDEYLVLESRINTIAGDLQVLYNEFKAIPGLLIADSIDKLASEEIQMLDDLKLRLRSYSTPPPLDIPLLATDYDGPETKPYEKYREGAILIQQLKDTSIYYGKVLDVLDRFFESRYELFVNEDESVKGKGFSDLELMRLMEIEKNINTYTDVIAEIDRLMADPNYASRNVDLLPERQEYVEKLADLKNRKERYLAFQKHQSSVEEAIFMEILDEYYALTREKRTLDDLLPEVEDVMASMIRKNYPRDQRELISTQYQLAKDTAAQGMFGEQNVDSLLANLDFLGLLLDYRHTRYLEQLRLSRSETIGETELNDEYQALLAEKRDLLAKHITFVTNNPGFQAMEQPSGGYLLNNAILYYNMAELQYAVDLDNPERALAYYRKALEIEPDFFLRDHALYNIAYISSESRIVAMDADIEAFRKQNPNTDRPDELKYSESDFAEAINAYEELADSGAYLESPLYDESVYRLGVLNFLIGSDANEPQVYYTEANRRFDTLLADPESHYYYNAMYQRAWVNMNQGDNQSLKLALADFVSLIEAVDTEKIGDPYLATDYKNNSIDNIAYSLIALDGADFTNVSKGVTEVQTAMAKYQDIKVKTLILDKAATLKSDMEAPLQAIDYLELRLQTTPLELNNPAIVDSIIKLYYTPGIQLRPDTDLAGIRAGKYDFIKANYNNNSPWYKQNIANADLTDPVVRTQLGIIKNAYEEIRIRRYNDLIDTASDASLAAYNGHVREYASYRELFGEEYDRWMADNHKAETELLILIAEKRDEPEAYMDAINAIHRFNDANPGNNDYFNNEGLAYTYARKIHSVLSEKFKDPGYKAGLGLPANPDDLYTFYRDASLRFYGVLLASDSASARNGSPQILMDLATIESQSGRKQYAKEHYLQILNSGITLDRPTQRSIYINLARLDEDASNFSGAETYYTEAQKYANDAKDRDEIEHLIKLQIQNSYEQAETTGNYRAMAAELDRLAEKFSGDTPRYEGYRYQASEALVQAGAYNDAIAYKLDLAKAKKTMDEKYFLYYESWNIAETRMKDYGLAKDLKNEFIALYPASNLAFNLRVDMIENMKKDPSQRNEAAGMYLALHDEVRAGKIDSGDVPPEDIYLWAVDIYREDQNQDKIIELLPRFVQTYPNHSQRDEFLTVLADAYLARGDDQKFEYYARELYLHDKAKSERYLTIANRKLGTIARDFDNAFAEKNWEQAFQKRDEFKQLESQYRKEGLPVESEAAYAAFSYAESEYEAMRVKQAYLQSFDRQLRAIEQGDFLTSSPNQLVMVNNLTTWRQHLFGGTYNRVPGLKARVEAEYGKIVKLLGQPEADYLDNGRRLKALNLICRINDYAAEVVETQVNKYIQSAYELAPFRDRQKYSEEQFEELVNGQLLPYAREYIDQYHATSSGIYLDIFNNYSTAGYDDQYTEQAKDKLLERDMLPDYVEQPAPLDSQWDISLELPEGGSHKVTSGFGTATTPEGKQLSSYQIPANHTLVLERRFNFGFEPEFAFLHVVYAQDPQIYVNGELMDPVYVAVDTLEASDPATTRYAVRLDADAWKEGENDLRCVFANNYSETVPLYISASVFLDAQKVRESIPTETMKILTDANWSVVKYDAESGKETMSDAVLAEDFNIPVERSVYLTDPGAQAIWTEESQEAPANEVVFETHFSIGTEFVEGYIDFVAPDNAKLYLNGEALGQAYPLSYDTDPFQVYPIRAEFPAELVRKGRNTIRLVVSNESQYRGMMAELGITQSVEE
jgi:hypothetical protein